MKINHSNTDSFSFYKQMIGQMHQKKEMQPINKVAEFIKSKMTNEAVALELSNEGIQRLKIRNLHKVESINERINNKLEEVKQKLDYLSEVDKSIDEIYEIVNEFMKNYRAELEKNNSQGAPSNKISEQEDVQTVDNSVSKEMQEEAKTIEELMKNLADMIEAVEKMKAQREGTEYISEGSIAEGFRNVDFIGNTLQGLGILGQGKELIRGEIHQLYKEIAELQNQVSNMLGLVDKNKESNINQLNLYEMIESINSILNKDMDNK